ncbi:uncharacterized protein A1O9_04117 [Exophiala aquamarina CBS 119918]|uniref:Xeroderma pigmentosum group C-complementing protein n=1 Tax=Exophiala aquamarina CBS 119918 TaxID=1182545 RepID=A0A072PJ23_9EURO|nr:uncharacterized protein A1O9_04117 [Exophiala aquamarina CBS 119918]KEF59273.1 hypothetical protein A1O9_04117 [Exophiala aquamarina CBS 119918]
MPPFLPRKRLNSTPPASARSSPIKKAKLADVLDAESRNTPGKYQITTFSLGSDESDSSLSDIDNDKFEDVLEPEKAKIFAADAQDDQDDDEEDVEWEDAGTKPQETASSRAHLADGPIELIFRKDDNEVDYGAAAAATSGKKGPTKREKEARVRTHQLHVQFLLWHNSIRNRWISDQHVQQTLVQQLPPQISKEIDKWKRASGLPPADTPTKTSQTKDKKRGKQKKPDPRIERDWGRPSQRMEVGRADMSHGDPIIPLMKVLAAYWKKRFAIIAPGLRKRGYGTKQALKQAIYSFRNDEHDPEEHGERIRNIIEFREAAKKCEGSRDVGAQLFTALLRAIGIESRLVASLQPSGFGWTKAEQMSPRKPAQPIDSDTSSDDSDEEESKSISEIANSRPASRSRPVPKSRKNTGSAIDPVKLDLDTEDDKDDASLIDITPSMPRRRSQKYDRDNPFPIYWTEAISPVTNKVLPVSPLILTSPVAATPDVLYAFEPRGAKAEKTKTVIAYVVAYSSDGTAKDVTVRYLKNRIWPGKTKGFRFPVEKIPIYTKHGKIKRYEDYDWFKRVMSGYRRPDLLRTAVDDVEDASDLVPQLPPKKEVKDEVDTLQSLKASADYVLERFLRREEALRPGVKPVRTFVSGKGDNMKEEPVFRRSDVERCLTAESWHKEGRRPKSGEAPLKLVPVRAVTLTRKREAEEHERQTGQKQMQGLYSWDQTEYIIPPPIKNGIIPKNSYGNIDCFVPSMVPKGAVHVPLRASVRICKKLDIDFAEAVTGFEFGNKRAVPICTGVVVAKENERLLIDAWTKFNEEQRKKEETKMEKLVLDLWRKFIMGLRIREQVHDAYGDGTELPALTQGMSRDLPIALDDDDKVNNMRGVNRPFAEEDSFGGGFLLDDEDQPIPEDLEMFYHDAPPDVTAKSKDKERALDKYEYPTPSSVSPLKPGMRRQRKSLLRESCESEGETSELSSVPSASEMEEDMAELAEDGSNGVEGLRPQLTATKHPRSRIEVVIPSAKRRSNRFQPTIATQSRDESNEQQKTESEPELSSDNDPGSEDDYQPPTNASLRKISKKAPARGSARSVRKDTSTGGAKSEVVDSLDGDMDDNNEHEIVTSQRTRTPRRGLRRDSIIVTSPYFKVR